MSYRHFIDYNIIGEVSWVTLLFGIDYFFGNIDYVKNHFSFMMIVIILVSVILTIVTFIIKQKTGQAMRNKNKSLYET